MPAPRVVSLLPSATEMAHALGAHLVGISHECDFPADVRGLPVLTSSRIELEAASADIDRAVRDALSIYHVDSTRLAELAPDVILTQDLCQVCAVSLDDVKSAIARLARREQIEIVTLHPLRLEHVLSDLETVATALGVAPRGKALRASLESRIAAIAERARHAATRPRVATVEWLDPLMLGGTWMPELIELAGGISLGGRAGELAPTVTRDQLRALEPDLVLVKPCGFDVARTLQERALIERSLSAPRVIVSDGNAFFNRPGPRLVESLEILAAALHPALFPDFVERHRAVLVSLRP